MTSLPASLLPPQLEHERLSPRELAIAESAISTFSLDEIAQKHFVCVQTVKLHLSAIYKKCGVRNRAALIAKYMPAKTYEQLREEIKRLHEAVDALSKVVRG